MEGRKWFDGGSADAEAFDPKLPANLSFHLSIHDASLILQLRTLEPASPNPHATSPHPDTFSSLTGGLSSLFYRGPKLPVHDEVDRTFVFRGQEVRVKEKVRVESASDPSLMSVMAKVGGLEHGVRQLGRALATVMGVEGDDGDEL
jgi:Rogdi leucine zipper containing protein